MRTATERFKWLLANALERVCALEAELEQRDAEIAELKAKLGEGDDGRTEPTRGD